MPRVALVAAVTCNDAAVPVVVAGTTVTVTPAGAPVTTSAIFPVRLVRVRAILLVAVAPCATDSVAGVSAIVNENAVTVSVNVEVTAVTPLPVALTVIGYTPGVVVAATVNVTVPVELPPVVSNADTAAVTPVGAPLTVTVGTDVNPPAPVTVTPVAVVPPCGALALGELSATLMVGVGVTVSDPPHAWTNPKVATKQSADKRREDAMNGVIFLPEGVRIYSR